MDGGAWYVDAEQPTIEGQLVEVHGLEEPLEAGLEAAFLGQPETVDANGARGRVVGWSEEDGKYIVETFDGLIIGVPEENLQPFQPPPPEDGGFDIAWPSGPVDPADFAGAVAEVLKRKGWCLVQMFSPLGTREAAVTEALELVDWRLTKRELEVQCMGHENITKYADLDPDDVSKDCEDALALCDRALTHMGLLLAPLAQDYFGFSLWGRHNGQARVPFRPSEEEFLRPGPLTDSDYDAGGKVYSHLDFLARRKLLALYLVDNEGGDLLLHPVEGASGSAQGPAVRLPLSAGKLLVLLPGLLTYTYRPRGERSLLLQSWYVTDSPVPDLADPRVVPLPDSQQGERVHIRALQFRFGGEALGPEEAWNMWVAGTDCALVLPQTRFDVDAYYKADGKGLLYTCHYAGIREDVVMGFDYHFFDLTLQESQVMSPEQKNILEAGYEVLAAAGYTKQTLRGLRCGVYLGDAGTDWKAAHSTPALTGAVMSGREVNPYIYSGWQIGMACSRLSHLLDMRGPCFSVDTACSSSLVALGQASRTLVNPVEGQIAASAKAGITKALVMGLCLDDGPHTFIGYCAATMLSRSGRSFTFDESANGFLRGEGCGGAFVQLSDADADAQLMLACVIGSSVNQDGRSASMTAPNGPSQQMCIKASMAEARLKPSEITIAECHGTGTSLGDPIEVGALRDVMKDRGGDPIIMTTGKANFGHMEACAGIGGIAKCILMLNGMTGACNVHLRRINPHIEFVGYPAVFVDENVDGGARCGIAGVSSFGVGGTNARADLWGRSRLGHLATTEVNTFHKLQLRGAAYARVALNGQPGPGVADRVFIMGSWDNWSSMEEMEPAGDGEFAATVRLGDARREKFRIVLNEDREQTLYPAEDLAGQHAEILGPDWEDKGRSWLLDGRADGAVAGDAYTVTLEWRFSWDLGEHRRVSWAREHPDPLRLG